MSETAERAASAAGAMSTASVVLRGAAWVVLALSGLPMLLITLGMLAITGQQCTPTSVTHTLGDQLGIIAVAFGLYALPAAPTLLLARGNPGPWRSLASLLCALLALAYAVLALGMVAIGTMC